LQHVRSTALGRGTYGGCVVGQDGQGLLRTLKPHVRRLLARRAASPNPDGRFEHTPLHTATRRPQHDGWTPWSAPAALRVRVCESCLSCVATRLKSIWSSAGGSHSMQQCTGSLPIPTDSPRWFSHTSGETQTREARPVPPPTKRLRTESCCYLAAGSM
jgi:hypothetical protein